MNAHGSIMDIGKKSKVGWMKLASVDRAVGRLPV
jgi:hypothetical protein